MKRKRIVAVLMAVMMMTGALLAGCDKKNSETSVSGSDVSSDTGLSIDFDPNAPTTVETAKEMSFENNYDQAAIEQMNKVVTIHGMTFTKLEYNYYYANEYTNIYSIYMQSPQSVPMTDAGFIDLSAEMTEGETLGDYLNDVVVSDLQGEVYLLEYAQKFNLELDDEINKKINEMIDATRETAEGYGMTLDDYLKSYYGPDATEAGIREVLQRYELVNVAMKHYVENCKFAEGEDQLPVVYHVLYTTMDLATGTDLPEDQQEEAKKKADALLAAVKTLDDMKTKGEEGKTAGEVAEAAQYTVSRGQMVQEFEDWCFADHKVGDTGIVKTTYGYHVMYFVGTEQADEETKQSMAFDKLQEELQTAFEGGDYVPAYAE